MDDSDRYNRGMARRRQVLGSAAVERANVGKTAFNSEFQEFITGAPGAKCGPGRISTNARAASWSSAP